MHRLGLRQIGVEVVLQVGAAGGVHGKTLRCTGEI
jgi:hypothetical protein